MIRMKNICGMHPREKAISCMNTQSILQHSIMTEMHILGVFQTDNVHSQIR